MASIPKLDRQLLFASPLVGTGPYTLLSKW